MTKLKLHTQLQLEEEVIAEGEHEAIHDKIMKIVSMLPKDCQNSFYMTTMHGLSDRETATFLNCSAAEVREHMDDAVRWIRENVERVRSEIISKN